MHTAMRLAVALAAMALFALAGCGGGNVASTEFALNSPAFAENTEVPAEYSCDAGNAPPPLHWQNVPTGAESLAVVVDDPDAPHGRYVHWVVTGIPPSATEIVGGELPDGAAVSMNSSGKADYLGPCPPPGAGVHHYRFQLYALRKSLTLPPSTPVSESTATIANLSIAVARTVGLFHR